MRCFVELNHSPFSPILCRCTSCRDDVVTMAAKPRRRRREERDGERKSRRKQIQNQIQRRRKKEDREEKKGGERKTERGPEEMLMWEPTIWSPLLSLHEATDLSVFESASCRSTRRSASVPLILCLICQFKRRLRPVMTLRRLDSSVEVQTAPPQPPHPDYFLYKNQLSSPSHNWVKLGGHASLFSDWIVCWHFTQCELCQGCVCVCVGDFSILFGLVPSCRVCHPSPDVRCNWFERVCPLFLHFSVLHRH